MRNVLERQGNPQDSFQVVQVAGTNGKLRVSERLLRTALIRLPNQSPQCYPQPAAGNYLALIAPLRKADQSIEVSSRLDGYSITQYGPGRR